VASKLGARPVKTRGSSRFLGVHWDTAVGRWAATITDSGPPPRTVRIAHFDDEVDAARAYDAKARELLGARARLNFPLRVGARADR